MGLSASAVDGRLYFQTVKDGVKETAAVTASASGVGGAGSYAITDKRIALAIDAEVLAGIGIAIRRTWK